MNTFFASVSPLHIIHIKGNSMLPTFSDGERVLVLRFIYKVIKPRCGALVVAKDPRDGKLLLKRVTGETNGRFILSGDNLKASTDSREFGMISKSALFGKVIGKI